MPWLWFKRHPACQKILLQHSKLPNYISGRSCLRCDKCGKVGWLNKCREFVKYEFVCRLVVRRLIALGQGWTSWLLLDTSWCSRAAMYVPVTLKATLPDCRSSGVDLTTKQKQGQLAFLLLRRFGLCEADAHLFVWRVLNSRREENILIYRNSSKSQLLKSWVATSFLLSFTIL